MNVRISLVAGLVSAALLAACSSNDDTTPGSDDIVAVGERKLRTFGDGAEFIAALRTGLIAQASAQQGYGYGYPEIATDDMDTSVSVPVDNATDAGAGAVSGDSATSGESGTAADGNQSGNDVTSTNVQEQGVDEQDWVKVSADGNRLYVLDSAYPDYAYPVDVGVADAATEIGSTADGSDGATADTAVGTSMPVSQGYTTTLRILQLDADSPDASSLAEVDLSLDGRYAEGFYLYESDGRTDAIVTSSGNNYWGYWSQPAAFGGLDSLITRIDVTNAVSAQVTDSLTVDGQIVSSRRIGKYLFFASRFYPNLGDVQPYELTAEQWEQAVNDATDTDLLPQYSANGSESRLPLIDPAGCFVSDAASADDFHSPDIITLAVVDLDTLTVSDSKCYLGASETLYASPEAVFLATTQYDYAYGPVAEDGAVIDVDDDMAFPIAGIAWYDPRVDTDIHQFDIEDGTLVYAGTGTVQGHLGWNALRKPFRMSEKDGYLRVATFNDRQGSDESPILVSVLQADGTGTLKTVSSLPNASRPGFIGKPGEKLYASRFLGDRAYLVTFRQTDPLYVVDLVDPADPFVAGELQIDGYSDYLHPISEDYLLGIGKDAVAAPDSVDSFRGALAQGIKLSLFDVSNPQNPREIQSVLVGERGTDARALNDHRAITVQPATDQHPTRVSFGIDVHGQAFPASSPTSAAWDWKPWNYTGLHGFDIRTGSDAGITSRGALVVATSSAYNAPYSYPEYANDRSVMVNDAVFYIRGRDVYAAPWDDLASPTPAR